MKLIKGMQGSGFAFSGINRISCNQSLLPFLNNAGTSTDELPELEPIMSDFVLVPASTHA